MFTTGEFKMAGSQVVWNYKGINSIDNLRGVVHERLIMLLDRYQYSMSSISHIIITFVPSSFELKSLVLKILIIILILILRVI